MIKKSICSDSRTSYMQIVTENDIKDSLCAKMLGNNKISGFLSMEYRYIDNVPNLYYDISGMQNLEDYAKNHMFDYKMLQNIYKAIINAVLNGETYFLDENSYIIKLDYLYVNHLDKKVKVCCVPDYQGNFQNDVKTFTEEIMKSTDHKDEKAVKFIYELYDLLCEEGFVVSSVEKYINGIYRYNNHKDNEEKIIQETDNQKGIEKNTAEQKAEKSEITEQKISVWEERKADSSYHSSSLEMPNVYRNDNVKITFHESDAIMYGMVLQERYNSSLKKELAADKKLSLSLEKKIKQKSFSKVTTKDGTKPNNKSDNMGQKKFQHYETVYREYGVIWINRLDYINAKNSMVTVGRNKDNTVYIPYAAVSRKHASLCVEDGRLYVTDCNSFNGTYLNGQKITANVKTPCKENDVITFADMSYCIVSR